MSGPRRRKFVGPIVSRITWHGGRGRQRSRWALLIALRDKHRVAVGVEAIALGDGVAVRAEQRLAPAEGGREQQQRRAREVEVRDEGVDQPEAVAGVDEELSL